MKICVISNSHAASLRLGWEQEKSNHPDIDVTFFASPSSSLRSLDVQLDKDNGQGVLYSKNKGVQEILMRTSGGLQDIEVADYDVFLIYGLSLSLPLIEMGTSSAVEKQTYEDAVANSISYLTLSKIRKFSPKAIVFIGHNPLPARQISMKVPFPPVDTKLIAYDTAFGAIKGVLGADKAVLLAQPKKTVGDNLVTKEIYCKGSVRLDIGTAESLEAHYNGEIDHMNANFGQIYWQTHLPTMIAAA